MILPRLAPAALAACLAAAAAAAEPARTVTGEAACDECAALPEDAFLRVELRDASGALFAESGVRAAGRDAPLPFALAAPEAGGALRAAIEIDGETRWRSEAIAIPPGATDLDLGAARLSPFVPMRFVSRLRCGPEEVLVGVLDGAVAMEARGARHVFAPAPAGSGAKSARADDADTWLWTKGETAMVSLAGEELPECRLAPTIQAPEFRAGGNEPGWSLEVGEGRAALTLDYGAVRREGPLPPPGRDGAATILVSGPLDMVARIEDRLCHDDATGMPHPATVEIETGGRRLLGCGGAPLSLLLGEWRVEGIEGATLAFRTGGAAGGRSGCNAWRAGYRLTGEGLGFGEIVSTRMACAGEAMAAEGRLFAALGEVAGFDVAPDGAVLLLGVDGAPRLMLRR
mgnify:CR=1 FL=1